VTVSSDTPSASPPAGAAPPPAPAGNKRAPAPLWAEFRTATGEFYAWLMRPRVRLTLTGALLLLVGGLIATNTVWTLPLVIVGALMVAVAWIGHRLEGRFAVEWGEAGTQLAFNATIKAPHPDAPALGPAAPARSTPAPPAQLAGTADDVIDGEAHTVEINVSELKALIAAAEAGAAPEPAVGPEPAAAPEPAASPEPAAAPPPEPAAANGADVRDIRIRRLADDSAPAPRPAG
jgi:hypothetical protein